MKSIKGRVPQNFNPGGSGGFMAQARNMAAQRAQQPQAPQQPQSRGIAGLMQRAMAQRQMAQPPAQPPARPSGPPAMNRQMMMANALRRGGRGRF